MGVLQNHIADAQVIGHPAQVFQFERFALAGQIVKFPSSLRFEDALLGESLKQGNRSGWLRWLFHLKILGPFKPFQKFKPFKPPPSSSPAWRLSLPIIPLAGKWAL